MAYTKSRPAWQLVHWQLRYTLPILILLFVNVLQPKAQAAYFWSEQKRIPDFPDFTQEPPFLIADQNKTVHAFNSQPLDLNDDYSLETVFYRQWTADSGWTSPNDILYPRSGGSLQILGATSDASGIVYLLYQQDFVIYLTSAYLAVAGNSTKWSPPVPLAGKSMGFTTGFEGIGAIASDGNGNLIVIYSGSEFGRGLYSVASHDFGVTWSSPYPVSLTGDESMSVTDPAIYVGRSGKFHAVWATYMASGAGGPGYYARFDVESKSWTEPMDLDLPGIRTPSVIEYEDQVIVSYYHVNVNGNWWRLSNDGGNSWSLPSQVSSSHVGTNGRVSFAVDSNNTLYGFFGERINDLNHGMWQVTWTGYSWTEAEPVVKGPTVRDAIGGDGFDPRAARAVISNGNMVLVTWATDGFAGENGAWYSYRMLNAPALPSIPNVNPEAEVETLPAPTADELILAAPTNTPVPPGLLDDRQPPAFLLSPQTSILAGVILAFALVVGIFILRYLAHLRHR